MNFMHLFANHNLASFTLETLINILVYVRHIALLYVNELINIKLSKIYLYLFYGNIMFKPFWSTHVYGGRPLLSPVHLYGSVVVEYAVGSPIHVYGGDMVN